MASKALAAAIVFIVWGLALSALAEIIGLEEISLALFFTVIVVVTISVLFSITLIAIEVWKS